MVTSKELSPIFARDTAIKYLDLVKKYLENLNSQKFSLDRENSIIGLEELKLRLMDKSHPLTHYKQSDFLIATAVNQIIHKEECVSLKLKNFWMAHIKMADLAMSQNKTYNPQQFFDKNNKKILEVDKRYIDLAELVSKDKPDDVMKAYSVFYIHILKTEVIEYSFLEQFKNLLKEFDVIQEYDPEDIFSATNKVRKGNEWKTEAKAIRDALSHNKYTLEIGDSSWKVIFDNTEKGYDFKKTFTNSEFYKYMNNTDTIYRGSMMLLYSFISMILIQQHCIEKKELTS